MARSKKRKVNTDRSNSFTGLNDLGNALDALPLENLKLESAETSPKPPRSARCDSAKESQDHTPPNPSRILIRKETAHRGGKAVLIIHDFPKSISNDAIEFLAKSLRKHCGTGGTTKNRTIEIQGEQHLTKIRSFLSAQGFRSAGIS
ncbi:MAG: translation initiation factor [Verrucomicrobiota bacterium]